MINKPLKKEEQRVADIAKERITLKRELRKAGCPIDNDDSTERLKVLVKFISEEL